jgi:DNA-3-methyladenine glycosylase
MMKDWNTGKRLEPDFYVRSTVCVARDLLGCVLIRKTKQGDVYSGIITETEAYTGPDDSACHSSRGLTERNRVMFYRGGYAYIYFIYGLHSMLNVVSEDEGKGCAVLIRSVKPTEGEKRMFINRKGRYPLADGPARLTQAFNITCKLNGTNLATSDILYICEGIKTTDDKIIRTPRIGIDYAEPKDRDALLRFILKSL